MSSDPSPADALEAARVAGFDLDLIDTNLDLPIEERWRQHDLTMETLLEFEAARIARDARLSRPA